MNGGIYPCLCVDDLERAVEFYTTLLGLPVSADLGWYVELAPPGERRAAAAFVRRGHPSVPPGFDAERGVLVSAVVADVAAARRRAGELGRPIARELCDEDFGQRHFMVVDPDGFLVDVIEPIRPSLAIRRALVEGRRRRRRRRRGP